MKNAIYTVLITAAVFLLLTPALALDNNSKDISLSSAPLHNKHSAAHGITDKQIAGSQAGLIAIKENINNITAVVQGDEANSPFNSYLAMYKAHQPLVYRTSSLGYYGETAARFRSKSMDLEFPSVIKGAVNGGTFEVGTAFLTNLVVHEMGHVVVADYVGATKGSLNFFQQKEGSFFLGTSTVKEIDVRSQLPYTMGGEMAADLTFEHALKNYREKPTLYNKSLLFFSGFDFLSYCVYSFYLSDGHPHYDPVAMSNETGISRDMIFSLALAKTMINAYRVHSGQDRVVPYFTVDKRSAILNLSIAF